VTCDMDQRMAHTRISVHKRKGQLMALVRGWGRWYPVESVTIEGWFVLPRQ
jgi:hypothetical protein